MNLVCLVHSFAEGHFQFFHLLAVVDRIVINIAEQVSVEQESKSFGHIQEWLGPMVDLVLIFLAVISPQPHKHFLSVVLLISAVLIGVIKCQSCFNLHFFGCLGWHVQYILRCF